MSKGDRMQIPILDLKRQYAEIEDELLDAVKRVLASGGYILGSEVAAFEKEAAAYCGVKHAIGVASGTDALLLSLKALDVGPGDAVILPSFTFFATAGVVHNVGATPILVDIDPKTFNLDPDSLQELLRDEKVRSRAKAIIPVHLYGQMADMDEVAEIADGHGLAIVEDAAQAIGTSYKGRRAGSVGRLSGFSFYPTKNLGACGDGGMITTDDDEASERIRLLRVHGAKPKYFHRMIGTNSRLDAVQAAILRVKLRHLEAWNRARRAIADIYDAALADVPGVVTPQRAPDRDHIFHQYTIRVAGGKRDALREHLKENGIGSMIYYPVPVHLQECFASLGYTEGSFPAAEAACREVLSLPVFPEMTEAEVRVAADSVRSALEGP